MPRLLRAGFLLALLFLATFVIPGSFGQRMSKEALKAEARMASAKTDVQLLKERAPQPSVPTLCTLDGTLGTAPGGGATGTISPRLLRGGVATTCAGATFPGNSGAGPYVYNVHYVTNNTASDACTAVTLHYVSGGTPTVNFQVAAFQAPFAPTDITNAARYLGDPGSSSSNPPLDTSFSVNVPAGATIGLVVFNTNASPAGVGTVYQINLDQDLFCGPPSPIIVPAGSTLTAEGCLPPSMAVDPGETVTVDLKLMNNGAAATTNLVATLVAGGGVTMPSGPQTYGIIAPGGMATGSFTFTADSMLQCGATITATLQLSDNGNPLANVTFNFVSGVLASFFSQNFDGVVAPVLPAGWVATNAVDPDGILWVTSTTTPNSAPNDAFVNNPGDISDKYLDTPPIAVTTAGSQIRFRNFYDLETSFDGAVLEVSSPNINGGTFTDITAAAVGGSFVSGGYNATISTAFGSPIAGRMAWSGNSTGYITTVANLGPNVVGQTIQLRFRMASDDSVGITGWRIDNVALVNPICCLGGVPPVPVSAVSRKTHGAAGDFDVNLPLVPVSGAVGIEPRNGPAFRMVVTFASPVTVAGVVVSTGTGAATVSVSGAVVTVNLTGVSDVQRLGVTLLNVDDGAGNVGDVIVPMGVLGGDVSGIGNRTVNSTDVAATKAAVSGGTVNATTFRADVNASGTLTSTDVATVKTKIPNVLPP